jgi:hypothetical protein
MTPSRTTLWGAIAGTSTLITAIPDIPGWLKAVCIVVTALGITALGFHSSDCPPNCPGTDAAGHRRTPPAPGPLSLLCAIAAAATVLWLLLGLTGCTAMRARTAIDTGEGTNHVRRVGTLTGITFFDSGQILGKTRVTVEGSTNGTWPAEVSTAGLTQQASSTGMVTIIQNFPKMVPVP